MTNAAVKTEAQCRAEGHDWRPQVKARKLVWVCGCGTTRTRVGGGGWVYQYPEGYVNR